MKWLLYIKIISDICHEKAKYFRNVLEDLSKNYEIKPFNLTFDVGEKIEYFICNVFDNVNIPVPITHSKYKEISFTVWKN